MNGADKAAEALTDRILAAVAPVRQDILAMRGPDAGLRAPVEGDPLTERCQQAARMVLFAEALAKHAADLERTARDALAECFADTGSLGVRIDGFAVTPSTSAPTAVITGAVPPEWMTTPAPAPDKSRMTKALRAGEALPFASLSNGRPTVSFRTDKTRIPA